ncbi:MAG: 16S rRNA (guanine(527)-N(7))-methyltransferase RsmG [Devosia sp.]|nr:16S rRNA (guanine(527)-N(7))-methyltransferase RsmG [Devosia sp.]
MPSEDALAAVRPYLQYVTRPANDFIADLERFSAVLAKWQRVQNLVSRETLPQIWIRHIADSLQVLPLLRSEDSSFLDLGSGGGFPAIPLAIALKGGGQRFLLVEPNSRKASFLRAIARELELPVTVEARRSEALDPGETGAFDIITSRALAPLTTLCSLAAPFFGPQTRAIFHKGREHVEELAESSAVWHHDVLITKSATDPDGVLIELKNLRLRTR